MNYKTTGFMVVLLCIVGAYFYFVALESPTTYQVEQRTAQADDQPGKPLFADKAFTSREVDQLEIARGNKAVTLAKTDSHWAQATPVRFPLADYSVNAIVNDAAALRYVSKFIPGKNGEPTLADIGLDKPRVVVAYRASNKDKPLHTIRLGRFASGGRGYVMLDDQPSVYVVNDALHTDLLDKHVADWRKKTVQVPELAKLDKITLDHEDTQITAHKIDGHWFLDKQGTQRADDRSLAALVDAVNTLAIRDFVEDQPKDMSLYGLDHPRVVLSLEKPAPSTAEPSSAGGDMSKQASTRKAMKTTKSEPQNAGKTYTLRLGQPADLKRESYYATWTRGDADAKPSTVVFTLGKDIHASLTKSIDDLRDPRIILAKPDDVRELTVNRNKGGTIHLVKSAKGWAFGKPAPNYQPDEQAIMALLKSLGDAKADGYVTEPALKQPAVTITLHTTGQTQSEQLALFGPETSGDKSHYLAVHGGETIGYKVPADQLAKVFAPEITLRNKTILDIPPDSVSALSLAQPHATFKFTRGTATSGTATSVAVAKNENANTSASKSASKSSKPWLLNGDKTFESDAYHQLLLALSPLRIEKWITGDPASAGGSASASDASTSGAKPITLTVVAADGSTHVLHVDPKSRQGTLEGVDASFILPADFVDKLTEEYRNRTVLSLTTDQIQSVTLKQGDKSITLKQNDTDQYVDQTGKEVDQKAGADVFNTLAGLEAKHYLPAPPSPPTVAPGVPGVPVAEQSAATVTVRTKDGKTYRLTVEPHVNAATIDPAPAGAPKWFSLDQGDAQKLLAMLSKDAGKAMIK